MCNCIGMARTFSEMEGMSKSIKPSIHHPNCEDYKLIEYSQIRANGSGIICEHHEVNDFIDHENGWIEEGDEYSVCKILLTTDQYESLPDSDGF